MKSINDMLDVNVVQILSYLRAVDLASVRGVNKKLFTDTRISDAIDTLVKEIYNLPTTSPIKKIGLYPAVRKPDFLYGKELFCLSTALTSQPPLGTKGFWISSAWLSSAKRYVDSLQRSLHDADGTPTKKPKKKLVRRRESETPLPAQSMTMDITCSHGGLNLGTSHAKRRQIATRMWYFLRKFYPAGPEFRCAFCTECRICSEEVMEAKASISEQKEAVISERQHDLVPDALVALCARRSGVPMACVTSRVAFYAGMAAAGDDSRADTPPGALESTPVPPPLALQGLSLHAAEEAFMDELPPPGLGPTLQQPLVPGLYNLVPRTWLKAWRTFVRDAKAPRLPHLNCTALMCQAHSQLVIPPHVEEYLLGLRHHLLGGLGAYPGEVAEIVSAEEWDALQDVFRDAGDFNVRFCLDGTGVIWNVGVCAVCNPFTYRPLLERTGKKKNGTRSPNSQDSPHIMA